MADRKRADELERPAGEAVDAHPPSQEADTLSQLAQRLNLYPLTLLEAPLELDDMAEMLCITPRRLQQLADGETLPLPARRGLYPFKACIQNYILFLQGAVKKRNLLALDLDATQVALQLQQAELREKMAKARKLELEVEQMEGKVVPRADVEAMVDALYGLFSVMLDGLPYKLENKLASCPDKRSRLQVWMREIRDLKATISQTRAMAVLEGDEAALDFEDDDVGPETDNDDLGDDTGEPEADPPPVPPPPEDPGPGPPSPKASGAKPRLARQRVGKAKKDPPPNKRRSSR